MKALLALSLLVSVTAFAATDTKAFPASQVKILEVRNSRGKIAIGVAKSAQASVESVRKNWSSKCLLNIQHSKAEGRLIVEVEDQSWVMDNDCEVDLKVLLPEAVAQKIFSGSGDVAIAGTTGPVEVKSGSGNVSINANVSELNAVSGSGSVEVITMATNAATIRSGSGDIRITYAKSPTGELTISSGSGDVNVFLPKNSTVLSDLISGSGKTQSEIPNTRGGKLKISAKAGSGDLLIKTAR